MTARACLWCCCTCPRAPVPCGSCCRRSSNARLMRRIGWATAFPTRRPGPCRARAVCAERGGCPLKAAGMAGDIVRCSRDVHRFHGGHRGGASDRFACAARSSRSVCRCFRPEEQLRQLEKYSEQPLKPLTEGGHVLGAWRGGFAFREPPYDLSDLHRRFVEHVLAANPGAAFRAACSYPVEKKLKSLKTPLTVFAPHDDIIEQTARVKPLLKASAHYIDLPELSYDPFHAADRAHGESRESPLRRCMRRAREAARPHGTRMIFPRRLLARISCCA